MRKPLIPIQGLQIEYDKQPMLILDSNKKPLYHTDGNAVFQSKDVECLNKGFLKANTAQTEILKSIFADFNTDMQKLYDLGMESNLAEVGVVRLFETADGTIQVILAKKYLFSSDIELYATSDNTNPVKVVHNSKCIGAVMPCIGQYDWKNKPTILKDTKAPTV